MRKQRSAKTPILVYCEGKHDAAFVRYIKQLDRIIKIFEEGDGWEGTS